MKKMNQSVYIQKKYQNPKEWQISIFLKISEKRQRLQVTRKRFLVAVTAEERMEITSVSRCAPAKKMVKDVSHVFQWRKEIVTI